MTIPIYQIDAFTDHVFGGNPAAVIPLEEWIPNYYVDVKSVMTNKVELLREGFVSQKDKLYFQEQSIRDFHTNYLCSKVGVGYVEQFRVERLFG